MPPIQLFVSGFAKLQHTTKSLSYLFIAYIWIVGWRLKRDLFIKRCCQLVDVIQVSDYAHYRDLLWTAPELLRMKQRPIQGTQKGDVYSFAIIVQEIAYRAQPYFCDNTNPRSMMASDSLILCKLTVAFVCFLNRILSHHNTRSRLATTKLNFHS
jgi:hypothetical protein